MFWCFIFDDTTIPYVLLYSYIYEKNDNVLTVAFSSLISHIKLELKFAIMSMAQMIHTFIKCM
jgi:hypothetical protein